jgi:hypothetical protein
MDYYIKHKLIYGFIELTASYSIQYYMDLFYLFKLL